MTYEELLERLNETGTLQLKDIQRSKVNSIDIREELKKQEEQYNREVNKDMEKNRDQWEEIMNQAEKQNNLIRQAENLATTSGDNESLTDPATISGDPDI